MANRFLIDMLMSRYGGNRDGRNPYGSRGGYVTSRDNRRDRGMDDYRDYDGNYNRYDYYDDYRRNDYYYEMDGRQGYRNSNYYDRDRGMDYGEKQYGKLSRDDLENWKRRLENADGSRGEHFKKEQLESIIRQMNIDVEKMGGMDIFCMASNMMYADYCNVAKKFGVDRIDFYVEMAKAFFNDKDYSGKPEEKLWLYYMTIVSE